jgi:hypothetical protein
MGQTEPQKKKFSPTLFKGEKSFQIV